MLPKQAAEDYSTIFINRPLMTFIVQPYTAIVCIQHDDEVVRIKIKTLGNHVIRRSTSLVVCLPDLLALN
jgi:hypothetical protein